MNSEARRKEIAAMLVRANRPLTGSELAARLGVSRQVIVHDIAIMRAQGHAITPTPQGYAFLGIPSGQPTTRVIACKHGPSDVKDELMTIVTSGGEVLDVIVEHPLYGEIAGKLMLRTVDDVERFMARLERNRAQLLSSLTGGIHLHTVRVADDAAYEAIVGALRSKGYLLEG